MYNTVCDVIIADNVTPELMSWHPPHPNNNFWDILPCKIIFSVDQCKLFSKSQCFLDQGCVMYWLSLPETKNTWCNIEFLELDTQMHCVEGNTDCYFNIPSICICLFSKRSWSMSSFNDFAPLLALLDWDIDLHHCHQSQSKRHVISSET